MDLEARGDGFCLGAAMKEAMMIAEAVRSNTSLVELNLDGNRLGPQAGILLGEVLQSNSTLKVLALGWHELLQEGGLALAEAMVLNRCHTQLHVSSNRLGPEVGVAFSRVLGSNNSLKLLDLSYNEKGWQAEGGVALAASLILNTTHTSLYLNSNAMGSTAGCALAKAIKNKNTLRNLDPSFNSFGSSVSELGRAMECNSSRRKLRIAYGDEYGRDSTCAGGNWCKIVHIGKALSRNEALARTCQLLSWAFWNGTDVGWRKLVSLLTTESVRLAVFLWFLPPWVQICVNT